jgi:DNA replication and repair protein RecF
LVYKPNFALVSDIALRLKQRFEKLRAREVIIGHTLAGPHRDDLELLIGGKEVRDFASEGQKRSCLAALRLAEWGRLNDLIAQPPLFSIDDFAIHRDEKRQSSLEQQIDRLGQVFLTSPYLPDRLAKPADKTLRIHSGNIE